MHTQYEKTMVGECDRDCWECMCVCVIFSNRKFIDCFFDYQNRTKWIYHRSTDGSNAQIYRINIYKCGKKRNYLDFSG